jgi:hypothetical protein
MELLNCHPFINVIALNLICVCTMLLGTSKSRFIACLKKTFFPPRIKEKDRNYFTDTMIDIGIYQKNILIFHAKVKTIEALVLFIKNKNKIEKERN